MAIAPQFEKLMADCQDMALSHLRPLVDRMFENADVALLDFAEKAESNMAQSLFFEAMSEVRKRRSAVEQKFYAELKQGFAGFPAKPEGQPQTPADDFAPGGLSLLETEEIETWVATQNAVSKLASRIMDQIFALKQRLSVVNAGDAIEENEIPAGPAWLGCAFQHAVEQLELENKVRIVFIALFDKYVLSNTAPLFDEYNKRLIERGILQNLRYEVRKQPGGAELVETNVSDPAADSVTHANPEATADNSQTPTELGDDLFGRICELMTGRRTRVQWNSGGAAGASTVASVRSVPMPSAGAGVSAINERSTGSGSPGGSGANGPGTGSVLVSHIQKLQSQIQSGTTSLSSSDFIENIEIDENLISRLQDTLAEEREKIFGGIDLRKIPAADTNVIELVGMLFEYMLKDEALPNVVKALLSRLHTPLLKVAVVDNNFFTHAQHSARMLLNNMTSAGIRWVEEDQIERGIFPKMKEIVDRVLLDFEENVDIFDTLLEDFNQAVKDLDHRAAVVEKRTAEAADGQEKLQAARRRAQQEVSARCQGQSVSASTGEFLQRIWADKLTFVLLRSPLGEKSEDWQAAIALTDRIVEYSLPPTSEQQRSRRRQALADFQQELRDATKTMQQTNKEKLIDALFHSQEQALEAIAPGEDDRPQEEHELPEEEPAHELPGGKSAPETREQHSGLSAEQQAMLKTLQTIPFGTWFEFTEADKSKRRVKLSWRSTVTEKFMFVDQMGVKATVIPMHELADRMLDKSVRIVDGEKKPFVDRALNAIHRMLDRAA
jgi:hypothetical protein